MVVSIHNGSSKRSAAASKAPRVTIMDRPRSLHYRDSPKTFFLDELSPCIVNVDWLNSHISWCQKSSPWSQGRKNVIRIMVNDWWPLTRAVRSGRNCSVGAVKRVLVLELPSAVHHYNGFHQTFLALYCTWTIRFLLWCDLGIVASIQFSLSQLDLASPQINVLNTIITNYCVKPPFVTGTVQCMPLKFHENLIFFCTIKGERVSWTSRFGRNGRGRSW